MCAGEYGFEIYEASGGKLWGCPALFDDFYFFAGEDYLTGLVDAAVRVAVVCDVDLPAIADSDGVDGGLGVGGECREMWFDVVIF